MKKFVYDAGVLVAADRGVRRIWAEHKVRVLLGIKPDVPAGVVARVSRSHRQAQLRRFLHACNIVPLDAPSAHEAGRLLAATGTSDVIDASVVAASPTDAHILTSDVADITQLVRAAGKRCVVRQP